MDVAITGASGLIGTALGDALRARGDHVLTVGRGTDADVRWDPMAGTIDGDRLEGIDAVVHLAGESLGERKWTPEQKERILESRVRGTELLATTIAGLATRPAVLLSGSAVGFYGDRGDEVLTEASPPPPPGNFLSDVCVAWEAATANAEAAGIRTVHLRTGIVLSRHGGALARMLTPFKLGARRPHRLGSPVHELDLDLRRGRTRSCTPSTRTGSAVRSISPVRRRSPTPSSPRRSVPPSTDRRSCRRHSHRSRSSTARSSCSGSWSRASGCSRRRSRPAGTRSVTEPSTRRSRPSSPDARRNRDGAACGRATPGVAVLGVTEGFRTPDLRDHNPAL